MKLLEVRQQKILQQLAELKEKLMSMHKDLNLCAKPAQPSASGNKMNIGTEEVKKPINVNI